MKFGYSILYVDSVESTLAFYEKAFGFSKKFITPEGDYAELITGETSLAFASRELGQSNVKGRAMAESDGDLIIPLGLAFVSQDVLRDYTRAISSGCEVVSPPVDKPWGQTVSYVRDLNGFLVEICSPVQA